MTLRPPSRVYHDKIGRASFALLAKERHYSVESRPQGGEYGDEFGEDIDFINEWHGKSQDQKLKIKFFGASTARSQHISELVVGQQGKLEIMMTKPAIINSFAPEIRIKTIYWEILLGKYEPAGLPRCSHKTVRNKDQRIAIVCLP